MNLVINSTFRPFTYDEMTKPLVQYKEAYDKVEQDYSDLVAQTEMWADIANRENSPEAYAMYNKYSNALNSVVDDFSKGMTLQNRGELLNMKRRYAKEITPIARASEAMKEANDYRAKLGADAIFQVGQYNSIDQFLHGKTANNNWQSREALTKKAAAISEAAMAEMAKDPEVRALIDNDQYLMSIIHNGGSYKDLQEAMAQAINANPKLGNRFSEIRQQILRNSGYEDYDAQGQRAIVDAVDTGMYAGLDKPTRNLVANQNFWSDKDKAMYQLSKNADARAEQQLNLSAATHGLVSDGKGGWVYDTNLLQGLLDQKQASKTKATQMLEKYPISQTPFFMDTKNPHKSKEYNTNVNLEDIPGTPIIYTELSRDINTAKGEDANYADFEATIRSKTGNDELTLRDKIRRDLKTKYSSASNEELDWIASHYYTIKVESNGNINYIPMKVGALSPTGTSSTGVNSTGVAPQQ